MSPSSFPNRGECIFSRRSHACFAYVRVIKQHFTFEHSAIVHMLTSCTRTLVRKDDGSFEVGAAARAAVRFIHAALQRPPPQSVHVQPLSDFESTPVPPGSPNDDHVLGCGVECCARTSPSNTILLSNDTALLVASSTHCAVLRSQALAHQCSDLTPPRHTAGDSCVKAMANGIQVAQWGNLPPLLLACAASGETVSSPLSYRWKGEWCWKCSSLWRDGELPSITRVPSAPKAALRGASSNGLLTLSGAMAPCLPMMD